MDISFAKGEFMQCFYEDRGRPENSSCVLLFLSCPQAQNDPHAKEIYIYISRVVYSDPLQQLSHKLEDDKK